MKRSSTVTSSRTMISFRTIMIHYVGSTAGTSHKSHNSRKKITIESATRIFSSNSLRYAQSPKRHPWSSIIFSNIRDISGRHWLFMEKYYPSSNNARKLSSKQWASSPPTSQKMKISWYGPSTSTNCIWNLQSLHPWRKWFRYGNTMNNYTR